LEIKNLIERVIIKVNPDIFITNCITCYGFDSTVISLRFGEDYLIKEKLLDSHLNVLDNLGNSLIREELERYFSGELKRFSLVPFWVNYSINSFHVSDWQKKVWESLSNYVLYGEKKTYSELAIISGNPKGLRAVGNALGRNHIPVIIPCHRIIRSNNELGGFTSEYGRKLKKALLNHEAKYCKLIE